MRLNQIFAAIVAAAFIAGCSSEEPAAPPAADTAAPTAAAPAPAAEPESCENEDANRMALFGDVHVHTSFSFDALANATGSTPRDANNYARGEAIDFFPIGADGQPTGTAQIDRPLDFLAVTDHGEFLGERALCNVEGSPSYDTQFCTLVRSDQRLGMSMMAQVITTETPSRIAEICGDDGSLCLDFAKPPWEEVQDAANEANTPCEFTSFIAYEYTGTPGTSNYHRNVIFRNSDVPDLPVSYIDAPYDSALWEQLDAACDGDCDYLTIPHNTNLANGRMQPYMRLPDTEEARIDYAETRLRREPIMEIFQHKGASECINGLASVLGAPDELCNFEQVRPLGGAKTYAARAEDGSVVMGGVTEDIVECAEGQIDENGMLGGGCVDATDYQRSALLVGLREEQEIGANPIKLGIIAATDTHAATPGNTLESDWTGAVSGEQTAAGRLEPGLLTAGIDGNPGGLAGVWATQNTRDAIFDAMVRREVFGTSGPRMTVRFFASRVFDESICDAPDVVSRAYADGVPMGGDLGTGEGAPTLLAIARKDPDGQDLNEMQLIKGWVAEDGSLHNEVITIASADDGAGTLCTVFTDEDFDASQPTYWYLRAVEPPVARWHTHDCERLPEDERPAVCTNDDYPATIREMAWSSPIWYRP